MVFRKFTENTIVRKEDLLAKIDKIRMQGFSFSYGEQDEGTLGISFPVFDRNATVVAALSVSGPVTRLSGANREHARQRAEETAREISAELGYVEGSSSYRPANGSAGS
jgi:DNA-binding IclR family transcriptional regulator